MTSIESISYDIFYYISRYLSFVDIIRLTSLCSHLRSLRDTETNRIINIHLMMNPVRKFIRSMHYTYIKLSDYRTKFNVEMYNIWLSQRNNIIFISSNMMSHHGRRLQYFDTYRFDTTKYTKTAITFRSGSYISPMGNYSFKIAVCKNNILSSDFDYKYTQEESDKYFTSAMEHGRRPNEVIN